MVHSLFRTFVTVVLLAAMCLLSTPLLGSVLGATQSSSWIHPANPSIHNIGPVTGERAERREICTELTYRQVDDVSKKMRTGCFVRTAFGLYDSARSMAIFNGTDEAIPLYYNGQAAGVQPLPSSPSLLRFGGSPTLGTYAYLYSDLPAALNENKMWPSLWRYKEMNTAPNAALYDGEGRLLRVNTGAMGFSNNSQWMITDSPAKAIVRMNLTSKTLLSFDHSLYREGLPLASHNASMAITEDGRFAAIISKEFQFFRVYDLSKCSGDPGPDNLTPLKCPYFDYWEYFKSQVSGNLLTINQLTFLQDGVLSFIAKTHLGSEQYLLAPNGPITSLIPYLGLGDSFASGQGAFNYLAGTDTDSNHCHLSIHSYPLLINQTAFSSGGQSVACSGARIHDIGNTSLTYSGQADDQRSAGSRQADGSEATILQSFTPGYLAQQRFVASYQPGTITVQIGGNDIGFGSILLRCVSPIASVKPLKFNENNCYETYEDRLEVTRLIDRTYRRWVTLFNQIKQTSPMSRVYVTGYPQIVSIKGDCGLNTPLTSKDIAFAHDLTQYLNAVIQRAAKASGVHFLDISDALHGHELCSGNSFSPAVNGITAGNDTWILGQESFHPNALGHKLIAQMILNKTQNFADITPANAEPGLGDPAVTPSDPILAAQQSGRAVRFLYPANVAADEIVIRADGTALSITGTEYFLRPSSSYAVHINGHGIHTGITSAAGDIIAPITIPVSTPSGIATVDVIAKNQHNESVTIQDVVYIADNPSDYDGDNTTNSIDSCPTIPSTGIDADTDGIDDACDSHINTSPRPETPKEDANHEAPSHNPSDTAPPATKDPSTGSLQSTGVTAEYSTRINAARLQASTQEARSAIPYKSLANSNQSSKPFKNIRGTPTTNSGSWPELPRFAWWWVIGGMVGLILFERGIKILRRCTL